MRRTFLALLAPFLAAIVLVSCEPPPSEPGNPNAGCPSGWSRISQQGWVQADKNGDGRVDFPQTLPSSGGGHIHEEFCAPVGVNLPSGQQTFDVDLMAHQGFAGRGNKVDVGLAPGGSSLGSAPAPSMTCGPKPQKCHGESSVSFRSPGGDNNLRVRFLPATLPSGERWFVGGELPIGSGQDGVGLGGKSWLDGYANARVRNFEQLVGRTVSGTVPVDIFTKGDNINWSLVHMDAQFGSDDEGTEVAARRGEFRGVIPLDTTRFTDGWHCVAVRADAGGVGAGRVHTGVIEFPVYIDNGKPDQNGTGACFPDVS